MNPTMVKITKKGLRKFGVFFLSTLLLLLPLRTSASSPILIEGAMACETDLLIEKLANPHEKHIGGWRFVRGELQGIPVVVSVTSIGMANAAAATALGIYHFHPVAVINQGTSGGHDPALHTFDIVLGAKTFDSSAWVSHAEEQGADARHIELLPSFYYVGDHKEKMMETELEADPELLEAAIAEARNYQAGRIVSGKISSSNNWNRQLDRIRFLYERYGSSCEDMESHAVAQVCRSYGIPFLGIRILSNTELHGEKFNLDTGRACQQYVLAVIKSYSERKAKKA